ncbi:MAG: PilZ domain-containing protein [Acidobacteria bacterium]|nr:PilZ domain-containing protein [Acidobacteriota bacterium]
MKSRFRFLNLAAGIQIAPDVVEIDTARERFAVVAQRLKQIAICGMWLNPYRGIPKVSFMPELDIVYLDERCEVIHCVASYRQASMDLPEVNASSAVVLPVGKLGEARIKAGDRLQIRDAATGVLRTGRAATAVDGPAQLSEESQDAMEASTQRLRSFLGGLLRWRSERRRGKRHVIPGSVAYFSIGSPQAQQVRDISTDGFYVRTEDRWSKGTSFLVGLEIINPASREVEAMISMRSKVVRTGPDGVGFVYDDDPVHQDPMLGATNPEHLVQLQRFMQRIQRG